MKKLLLLSAVLFGALAVSQAGVRFDIGIPLPTPPVVVTPPAYVAPAPTYVDPAPPCYAPAPEYYAEPPVVACPPVVDLRFGHGPYWQRYGDRFHYDYHPRYYGRDYHRDYHGRSDWHGGDHHDWDRGGHRR